MERQRKFLTPFIKQCFVTAGVCLNMAQHGLAMGFTAVLFPQLRKPGSIVQIDNTSGSWIALTISFGVIAGKLIVPTIMAKFGRRTANITSIIHVIVGWFCIVIATSVSALIIARFILGVSMGMSCFLGPVLIGEYTSPQNRGAFLTTISLTIATGVFGVHTLGTYLSWQDTALICLFIAVFDLLIVMVSPESPSFLADHGRFEDSKRVFRWLRAAEEEGELRKMIEAAAVVREGKVFSGSFSTKFKKNMAYFGLSLIKKEFYKPIFIMMHIYTLGQWAGANILAAYRTHIFHYMIGTDFDIALLVITLDAHLILFNAATVFVIKKINRRTMLFTTVGVNLFALISTATYMYAKGHNMLLFDHPFIGVALVHIHMFSIATGTAPLPFIIAGELFPLEYRSLAGGISVFIVSLNSFIVVKTGPFFFTNFGIHGTYLIYTLVVGYCLLIAFFFLPETKDRTLQDIENEFRGRTLTIEESKSSQSLHSLNHCDKDRRSSSPVVV